MNLCVIPARGGSKRIPKKNIKNFLGKPIIAYSIEAALKSNCFDKVIVSTDDKAIAKIAQEYGAEIPFYRPVELSDDYISSDEVVRHALFWYEEQKQRIDYVCCIYGTAPFVSHTTLQKGFELLSKSKKDFAFSVTPFSFPIQRAIKIKPDRAGIEAFDSENINVRSQDLELTYHDAGQFYWGKALAYIENREFYSDNTIPVILPHYLVQDIDTLEDWTRAELMFYAIKNSNIVDKN